MAIYSVSEGASSSSMASPAIQGHVHLVSDLTWPHAPLVVPGAGTLHRRMWEQLLDPVASIIFSIMFADRGLWDAD